MSATSQFTSPFSSRMTGIGSAFPKKKLTNDDLAKMVETNNEWILERTGIRERRIAEVGNPAEYNSALGIQAAKAALEMAGKTPLDIDMIVYATVSPDTMVPTTACWVQHGLGAKNASTMDVNAACSGFVYASSIGDQYIRSGQCKTILVVGADVLSSITNWEDRGTCILFGDAAGAAILERTTNTDPRRIYSTHLGSDGNLYELFLLPAGGSRMEVTPEVYAQKLHKMQMKGKEIFKVAVKTLAEYAVKALETNGLTINDLDWLVPHQANLRIIEAVAKRLDFPMSKVIVNIDRFGNTSSATVPTAFDEAVRTGKIQPGQTVLMDVFGAGLTFGSLLMRW